MGKRRQSCSASPVSTKATTLLPPTIPPWRNAQSSTITTYRLENKVFTAGAFCWLRLNCAVMVLEKHFTKTLSSGQPLGQPLMTRWFPGFLGLKPTRSSGKISKMHDFSEIMQNCSLVFSSLAKTFEATEVQLVQWFCKVCELFISWSLLSRMSSYIDQQEKQCIKIHYVFLFLIINGKCDVKCCDVMYL